MLSAQLFRETKRDVAYRRMLASAERCADFEARLLVHAKRINAGLDEPLPIEVLQTVILRLAGRIATWEHSPLRQRERQGKQAAARRRRNRGRDAQIAYLHWAGESLRAIARQYDMSVGGVRNVLARDLPKPDDHSDVSSSAV